MTGSDIDKLALEVLSATGVTEPSVPVERIVTASGLELVYETFDGNISGMLFRNEHVQAVGVNSSQSRVRQRFTMAHELGHFHLHKSRTVILDNVVRVGMNMRDQTSGMATDREEVDANRFAAALLMPSDWVHDAVEGIGNDADVVGNRTLDALASLFDVSTRAMENRLINLGLMAAG